MTFRGVGVDEIVLGFRYGSKGSPGVFDFAIQYEILETAGVF